MARSIAISCSMVAVAAARGAAYGAHSAAARRCGAADALAISSSHSDMVAAHTIPPPPTSGRGGLEAVVTMPAACLRSAVAVSWTCLPLTHLRASCPTLHARHGAGSDRFFALGWGGATFTTYPHLPRSPTCTPSCHTTTHHTHLPPTPATTTHYYLPHRKKVM